jgi:U4/U6 small nuclear ribonucleoprotein PRP31
MSLVLILMQVLGAKRKNLAGLSSSSAQPHQGFIYQSPLIQSTPPALRSKAARMVGAKCTLMARVDAYGQDPAGAVGQKFREEMQVS